MRRDTGVVLAAAGAGSRFGGEKQFLRVDGRALIHYSLDVFARMPAVAHIVLVVRRGRSERGKRILQSWRRSAARCPGISSVGDLPLEVVVGGKLRQDSIEKGLRRLRGRVHYALVHDVGRPLLRLEDAEKVLRAMRRVGAAAIGTPLTDSVTRVRRNRLIEALCRDEIWTVQTPQGARLEALLGAYERRGSREFTDEASALKAAGLPVAIVKGAADNLKITRPGDRSLVEWMLARRAVR